MAATMTVALAALASIRRHIPAAAAAPQPSGAAR